jgi:hypothetical protein
VDVSCGEHIVEGPGELRVPVTYEEVHLLSGFVEGHDQVAGLLLGLTSICTVCRSKTLIAVC